MKILIVEDERRIADALKEGLEQETYAVDVCYDGQAGYNTASTDEYDVMLLDVMLPGMNGYAICRMLRSEGNRTPIIMLTARGQDRDIIEGLDAGADDYLAKPFAFDVLLARVRALLRRPATLTSDELQAGELTLNTASRQVARAGKPVMLSAKEFAILEYLLRNKGSVLSKHSIMTHVWDFDADILPNTVEVFITYLRSKIDRPFKGPEIIKTVRGFGYTIEA